MYMDDRHKHHDFTPRCNWCHQVHKTYIMVIQEQSQKSALGGFPGRRLMDFDARDCVETSGLHG